MIMESQKNVTALITKVIFKSKFHSEKFNKDFFKYEVQFDGKHAEFISSKENQNSFIEGNEATFDIDVKTYNGQEQLSIKPVKKAWGNSNYAKAVKKEQSRYAGFAVSYCKDLIVANKLTIEQWKPASKDIFNFMVELDKSIEND